MCGDGMSKVVPFMAIGADELDACPVAGDTVICKRCGKEHTVKFGTDADGHESTLLGFVLCGGSSYLVTLNGKEL